MDLWYKTTLFSGQPLFPNQISEARFLELDFSNQKSGYLNLPLLFSKKSFFDEHSIKKAENYYGYINFGFNNFILKESKNVTKHWEL